MTSPSSWDSSTSPSSWNPSTSTSTSYTDVLEDDRPAASEWPIVIASSSTDVLDGTVTTTDPP